MSYQLTPAKRSHDRSRKGPKGKGKSHKSSAFHPPLKLSPGDNIFRVLCPMSNIGSVIGKSGKIIEQIRRESCAKVRVEEALPGSDERVIIILSSEKESEISADVAKEVAFEEIKEEDTDEVSEKEEGDDVGKGDGEDRKPEKKKSSAQMALLIVFEKMVIGESEKARGNEESDRSASTVVRLLVFTSQVGCILGKSGSIIKQMSNDSGAQIQVLPKDDVPPSASPRDEIVQISGEVNVVRNALEAVSKLLLENPPHDEDIFSPNPSGPSSRSFANHHPKSKTYQERGISGPMNPSSDVIIFRMLCEDKRIGGVIGRGGNVVRTLQQETGCEIKIVERVPGFDDRIIIISGQVHPDERISAPQDAVLRVQDKILLALPGTQEITVPAKLLINSNQIGCLLGKGGTIISEIRNSSGAHIRILGKDQVPSFASEDEEVIQINGEFGAVQEALVQITSRLKEHFFRHAFPNGAFLDQIPAREGLFHPHDDRIPFMHRPGLPPHIPERDPLVWGPQDYGAPPRRIGGIGGGLHLPVITNISVEVIVPCSCVDAIYGEDGGCLQQIREFSEAKVVITDPKPGATETLIRISGTPEQTHAAQSLIQAFVMIENGAS